MPASTMLRRVAVAASVLLSLAVAGCPAIRAEVTIEVTNHAISGGPNPGEIEGDLLVFPAIEGYPDFDLNGDGDVSDRVIHLLDLSDGTLLNLGWSYGSTIVLNNTKIEGDLVASLAYEASQGKQDLNGDDDIADWVPQVYRLSTGRSVSVGMATAPLLLGDEFLPMIVAERHQGQDLNGDGDTDDELAYVYDASTDALVDLEREALGVPAVGGSLAIFTVLETPGRDVNGDGDFEDSFPAIYDHTDGSITELDFVTRGGALAGNLGFFDVSERHQGEDLNGDGEVSARVIFVYDHASGRLTNVGVGTDMARWNGEMLAFGAFEWWEGRSLNGDDDLNDRVLQVWDPGSGEILDVGLPIDPQFQIAGRRVAFRVPEGQHGDTDLNGDGDTADAVLHFFDMRTGEVTNLGVGVGSIYTIDEQAAFFQVSEAQQGTDLNGDGVADGYAMHVYDFSSRALVNLELPARGGWLQALGRIAFFVPELEARRDLNGDGDWSDDVIHVYDGERLVNLGFAARGLLFDGTTVAFSVWELAQGGKDFNGDGDFADTVLHTARLIEESDPGTLIEELIEEIGGLVEEGEIGYRDGRAFTTWLSLALYMWERWDAPQLTAIGVQAFIQRLEAAVIRGTVEPEIAAPLLEKAERVLELLR